MTLPIAISIIGVMISGVSVFFVVKNSKRTDMKDMEEQMKARAETNAMLNMISQTTLDIKNELSSMKEDIKTHHDIILRLDENVKSLKHRMDAVEKRLEEKEE